MSLVASQRVLGLLSLADTRPGFFTTEHLRLAKSLAIPAAVAIQNARLYERAEIYGFELEQRLADLANKEQALQLAEQGKASSDDRFAKVFRSSPIAFSIATVAEGRLIDVNEAFERRYGYSREEILGHTVFEIGIWNSPDGRRQMLDELRKQGSRKESYCAFSNAIREVLETIYSADIIELDGTECLLAVSEDVRVDTNLTMPPNPKTATAR